MNDTSVRSLLDAAERAAEAGDFAAAADRLRDAAARQEAALGPRHEVLANIFNNLGVVLERLGDIPGAEGAYRRAYDIARSAFDLDHPFVATSEANLREFCAARGLPFERPIASPVDPSSMASAAASAGPSALDEFLSEAEDDSPAGDLSIGPAVSAPRGRETAMERRNEPSAGRDSLERADADQAADKDERSAAGLRAESGAGLGADAGAGLGASPGPGLGASLGAGSRAGSRTRPAAGSRPDSESDAAPLFEPPVPAARSVTARTAAGLAVVAVVLLGLWAFMRDADEPESGASGEGTRSAVVSAPEMENRTPAPGSQTGVPPSAPESAGRRGATAAGPSSPTGSRETTPAASTAGAAASAGRAAGTVRAGGAGRAIGAVTIVRSDVCRTFSTSSAEWRCDVVEGAVGPGRLVFYTRVRSASPLKIEHRWYHGDDLVQTVPLQIGANTGPGYRTYSQQTVVPSRRGAWRVELRGPNDEVMADVQFEVR